MTRVQINLLSMLKSVVQFFTENPTLLIGKPALQAAVDKLKAYIHDIELLKLEQAKNSYADVALKGETKVALVKAILKVLAGVGALGAATNDTRLKMAADVTEHDLNRLRDDNLITESHATYELALPIAEDLVIWDVTQRDITTLDTHSSAFDEKDPAIKLIKAHGSEATKNLKITIDEAYNFTKDSLDAMMMPVKMTNPALHGLYMKARDIINTAGGHGKPTAPDDTPPVQ